MCQLYFVTRPLFCMSQTAQRWLSENLRIKKYPLLFVHPVPIAVLCAPVQFEQTPLH